MPLIGDAVGVPAAQVLRRRERQRQVLHVSRRGIDRGAGRIRLCVLQPRHRVGALHLPVLAEALGQRGLEAAIVLIAVLAEPHDVDEAPVRERTSGQVREGIVHAGGRVVREVHVALDLRVLQPRLDVIGGHLHRLRQLPLHADGGLVAVRNVHVWAVDARQVRADASGRVARHRAEPRFQLIVGRRRPVERVGHKSARPSHGISGMIVCISACV